MVKIVTKLHNMNLLENYSRRALQLGIDATVLIRF